ncbi:MAG: ROK family protein [Hyphomonadaceae bacterium]|nr:ROK family protein [Hyphomonadaceae bacterium]
MTENQQATQSSPLVGAIDAGGTTFKCAVLTPDRGIVASRRIPTTSPEQTFDQCRAFFNENTTNGIEIKSLGIACFGPLTLDRSSPDYGMIHNTPKPGWSGANAKHYFERALAIPVHIETDVNAALLAERQWGAAQNSETSVYITVGTGIGAGIYANGGLLGGKHHPEFGHIAVERHPMDKDFNGRCSFHGSCLEGLASAPALTDRFGNPEKLGPDHAGWAITADYLAQACLSLIYTLRPERILLGGGLMQAPHIIPQIRNRIIDRLNNYAGISSIEIEKMITPPALGENAGLMGGGILALRSD